MLAYVLKKKKKKKVAVVCDARVSDEHIFAKCGSGVSEGVGSDVIGWVVTS